MLLTFSQRIKYCYLRRKQQTEQNKTEIYRNADIKINKRFPTMTQKTGFSSIQRNYYIIKKLQVYNNIYL